MQKQINWSMSTYFLGRNGCFKCNGINISEFCDNVYIEPITSKGNIGRCKIVLPKQELQNIIKGLKKIKAIRNQRRITA